MPDGPDLAERAERVPGTAAKRDWIAHDGRRGRTSLCRDRPPTPPAAEVPYPTPRLVCIRVERQQAAPVDRRAELEGAGDVAAQRIDEHRAVAQVRLDQRELAEEPEVGVQLDHGAARHARQRQVGVDDLGEPVGPGHGSSLPEGLPAGEAGVAAGMLVIRMAG